MNFNDNGVLDPGPPIKMTWEEFYNFFSFSPRRKELLIGLEKVLPFIKTIEATIYIDGSFVTNKLEPGDWDACYDCHLEDIREKMIELEYRYGYPLSDRKKQKLLYKGELFHARWKADEHGTLFIDFFQQIRNSTDKKGIVEIIL